VSLLVIVLGVFFFAKWPNGQVAKLQNGYAVYALRPEPYFIA
jgi:hypothetical protein